MLRRFRRPQARLRIRHGRAPPPKLHGRRLAAPGRCPLWPLATQSCSAQLRYAPPACWGWMKLEAPGSCPRGV
eukprot:5126524-Lingulodinium_polyedra.AAC.1